MTEEQLDLEAGDSASNDEKDARSPEFADDAEIDREVPVERENTLKRVREDYDRPWMGSIAEAIQNGGDAFGTHREMGVLEEDSTLEIEISIDTKNATYTYEDNAGGMTKEILEDNLVGIDTPNESKQTGTKAGAYGRGFYVIAMCGEDKTYVESRQGSEHHALTITPEGKYSRAKTPAASRSQLPDDVQGTYIHVTGVRENDLEKLSDWDEVEDVLIRKFTFLLLRDDVSVKYTIDGETHIPSPPDVKAARESDELLHLGKLPKFTAEGDEYQVKNLVVVGTESLDDLPWSGVAMLKGDIDGDPFMCVNDYKPHRIPSLRQPAKMIGWCDVRELCPDLENNSHTNFRGFESDTGIKEELRKLHDEHFKKGRTTEESEELASNITDELNDLLTDIDDFSSYRSFGSGVEVDEGEGDEDEGETKTGNDIDILRCQAGDRDFEPGETIPLSVTVKNPKDPESEKYEIYDIEISCPDNDVHREFTPKKVHVGENQTETFDIERIRPSEEGIYAFSASVRSRPDVIGLGEEEEQEELDRSKIYIRVGDPERSTKTSNGPVDEGEEKGGDDGDGKASIVHAVTFFPDEEENWKALTSENEDGFEVTINTTRPEWQRALAIVDNDDLRDEIQLKLGVEWGAEELILERNFDMIEELLDDDITIDGERAADVLRQELTDRAELLADLEAKIEQRHNIEYSN
ncbi:uncharacterized protein HHUB_3511 [Halobacterium hubeiense]|uniref:Uncharacterized protein n=1 Tax=Halobacterium hubeiense TaxID=1407499 RepID=A0A0U5D0W8_9EURY|nr:ATP-binding protein [Halobacterium hubeiense]CQH61653.1 uncharacterized protein HHUB_3511 [Halobacterium hubeiense]